MINFESFNLKQIENKIVDGYYVEFITEMGLKSTIDKEVSKKYSNKLVSFYRIHKLSWKILYLFQRMKPLQNLF